MGLFNKMMSLASKPILHEWQNVLLEDKPKKLIMTRKQLEDTTIQQVKNDMRIFDDCANLINSTLKPDVFFMRLELAEERLKHLVTMEPFFCFVDGINTKSSMKDLLNRFYAERNGYITSFINRYYLSVQTKAASMKTESGKRNQYKKFYESLLPYHISFNTEQINLVDELKLLAEKPNK